MLECKWHYFALGASTCIHIAVYQFTESFHRLSLRRCQHLENRVLNDPFVQRVYNGKDKVPTVILYTDDMLADIKRFCCSGPNAARTVIGFDKTFNLGQLHVTVGAFKHLAVTRQDTGEHPIFAGPMFIHGNSDYITYAEFFNHLASKIADAPCQPVIGSDDEKAMRKAIDTAFPNGSRISCVRRPPTGERF